MTPVSVSQLARNDHNNGVFKSAIAIGTELGFAYWMLTEPEQDRILTAYRDAWWGADHGTEVPA